MKIKSGLEKVCTCCNEFAVGGTAKAFDNGVWLRSIGGE